MQETRVQSLVQEDPTCLRATEPVCHSCWARALEPEGCNYWSPCSLEPVLCNKRNHCNEKLMNLSGRVQLPLSTSRESPHSSKTSTTANKWSKIIWKKKWHVMISNNYLKVKRLKIYVQFQTISLPWHCPCLPSPVGRMHSLFSCSANILPDESRRRIS